MNQQQAIDKINCHAKAYNWFWYCHEQNGYVTIFVNHDAPENDFIYSAIRKIAEIPSEVKLAIGRHKP